MAENGIAIRSIVLDRDNDFGRPSNRAMYMPNPDEQRGLSTANPWSCSSITIAPPVLFRHSWEVRDNKQKEAHFFE